MIIGDGSDDLVYRSPPLPPLNFTKPGKNEEGPPGEGFKRREGPPQPYEEDHEAICAHATRLSILESSMGGWSERSIKIDRTVRAVSHLQQYAFKRQMMGFLGRIWCVISGRGW